MFSYQLKTNGYLMSLSVTLIYSNLYLQLGSRLHLDIGSPIFQPILAARVSSPSRCRFSYILSYTSRFSFYLGLGSPIFHPILAGSLLHLGLGSPLFQPMLAGSLLHVIGLGSPIFQPILAARVSSPSRCRFSYIPTYTCRFSSPPWFRFSYIPSYTCRFSSPPRFRFP